MFLRYSYPLSHQHLKHISQKRQKKQALLEAEKVGRNAEKLADAAKKYFTALDEAMNHAERMISTVAPVMAKLVAVFR